MAQSNLALRIATVLDASGLRKADKGISSLEKSAAKLGKTLGKALGAATIGAFAASSVKAFMEDEKAAAMLANTVKNLGMSFELPQIEGFIGNMEKATGIADDELRPAMDKLLKTTKSFADSQQLLSLATEVSRGSGQDLATVTDDLTAAYAGNFKGLKKYKLGLTDAELKTMSFNDIMDKFNKQFKGSNAAYLKTYAGKMEVLSTAAGTAKETIGKGLVDALMAVTGSIDVQSLSDKLIGFAQNLADAFVKIGNLIAQNWAWVKNLGIAIIAVFTATKIYAGVTAFLGILTKIKDAWKDLRAMATGAALAEEAALNPVAFLVTGAATVAAIVAGVKLLDKLSPDKMDNKFKMPDFKGIKDPTFDRTKAEKLKLDKLNAKLAADEAKRKKAAAIFDIDKIQLIAALKGNLSKEERDRAELQLALLTENTDEVTRLTKEIAKAQGLSKDLTNYLLDLPQAQNPFVAWKGYLDEIELQAKRIAAFKAETAPAGSAGIPSGLVSGYAPTAMDMISSGATAVGINGAGNITVNVGGNVISQNDLIDAIQIGLQNRSLSGSPSSVGRLYGMFAP